jgi:hypothetical protein
MPETRIPMSRMTRTCIELILFIYPECVPPSEGYEKEDTQNKKSVYARHITNHANILIGTEIVAAIQPHGMNRLPNEIEEI